MSVIQHNYPYTDSSSNKFLNQDGTWQEVSLDNIIEIRDNKELQPGKFYRIIDYITITSQENTQSAEHQFDIIVQALNTNALNENAAAIQHEGDTYFAKSKLNAWQLKYSLENDKVKYGWADTANGKGVIWYMKDEWNNECCYDFKNIMFTRKLTNGALDDDNGTDTFVYTFNGYLAGNQMDLSNGIDLAIAGGSGYITMCSENIIKSFYMYMNQESVVQGNGLVVLNDNVFLCSANNIGEINNLFVFGNVFEECCFMNTLHGYAQKNVFGEYCNHNTLLKNCYSNTFGNECTRNTFGNDCTYNTFGDNCFYNTFGNYCDGNTFGNNCYSNTFGNGCTCNTFGINCSRNIFGNGCTCNTFGNKCYDNTLGDACDNNTFGIDCRENTFGDICFNNMFGNDCDGISFGTEATPINYVKYIKVENGVKYVDITTTATTSITAYLQNITISQGISGTENTKKTIAHPTINDTFQTTYQPQNSQVISV